ncbi:MAG: glycosyltransferase family 4 protein [Cyclobacteriaceae bacterium]
MRLLRITTVPISLKLLLRGQLEFMEANGIEVLSVSSDGPEVKQLKVPHRVVPMARAITPVQDLISLIRLILIMRKFRPDIVHTHTPKAGLLGMLSACICRVKVRVHTIAGLPWLQMGGLVRHVLKAAEALTIYCSTDTHVNSLRLMEILRSELPGIAGRRFACGRLKVPGHGSSNGIDLNYFQKSPEISREASLLRAGFQIASDDFVFCFVGRLVRDKGIGELVSAFDCLRKKYRNVRLILAGPVEPGRDGLKDAILRRIEAGNGIIAPGLVEDVRPWLAASDIFVFPSYREGFPNVLLQAGCMEVPVIASDINGCNEIVTHGISGLLIPPKSEDKLVQSMEKLMRSQPDRKYFVLNLKKYITENFDQQVIWTELLRFYRERTGNPDQVSR